MDKKYIELFKELARVTAISAEQVMDYDKEKGDDKGYETAEIMRNDFSELQGKLEANDFDGVLTKAEYAKLLIGTLVIANTLRDKVTALNKAINGYEKDLAPKLQKVLDESNSDEEAQKIAEEIFIIDDNK